MDYYVGGDLLTLLSKFEDEHGHVPEHMAKFYVAEMVLAIDSIHRLGYVHRDIKPDNVLLDINGHIKLGDFGSCLRRKSDGTVCATTAVGTPDYISPETLRAVEDGRGRYGAECDWWSLGICMYEMIYGETPFYAESLVDTYGKIMNHEEMFEFPEEVEISDDAKDLISHLICSRDKRLGSNGLEDFRSHPFFFDIDWENIRSMNAPYKPEVSSPTDTSNFDPSVIANDFTPCETQPPKVTAAFSGLHLPFIGFTYTSESVFSDRLNLLDSIQLLLRSFSGVNCTQFSSPIKLNRRTETEKQDEDDKEPPPREPQPPEFSLPDQQGHIVAQLKDENQILRKMLEDEKNQRPVKQVGIEELEKKIRDSKEKNRQLILDKQDLQKELEEISERYNSQAREWKNAIKQRDVALRDFEETNSELVETKTSLSSCEQNFKEKDALARQLQEKCDIYKSELRSALASRAEADAKLALLTKELANERSTKNVLESKFGEESSESIQVEQDNYVESDNCGDGTGDELLKTYKEKQLFEFEEKKRNDAIGYFKGKIEDLQQLLNEQKLAEQKLRGEHEEDKLSWNRQHQEHLFSVEKLFSTRVKALEAELKDLRIENEQMHGVNNRLEQELLCQQRMGVQIQEIIQFVADGKERQELLQDVTSRLAGELESFKKGLSIQAPQNSATREQQQSNGSYANTPISIVESPLRTWGSRRMNKQAKYGRFEAQQHLEAEIRAKQRAQEESRQARTRCDELERELVEMRRKLEKQRDEYERIMDENTTLKQQHWAIRHWPQRLEAISQGTIGEVEHKQYRFNAGIFNNSAVSIPSTPPNTRSCLIDDPEGQLFQPKVAMIGGHHQQYPFHPQFYENARFYTSYRQDDSLSSLGSPTSSIFRSATSPKAIQSLNNAFNGKGHHFVHASLRTPTKCIACTSVLIGADRQGMFCQDCHVACHVSCLTKVPADCPVPLEMRRSDGIDMVRGTGTAYQGAVKTPKYGGVKRGWQKTYVFVCDFKLYLYDCQTDKNGKVTAIEPQIRQILDMKDPDFKVSSATENDAIHASKSDLPKIFKVVFSQIHDFHSCTAVFEPENSNNKSATMRSHGSTSSGGSAAAAFEQSQYQKECALISQQYSLLMAESKEEAEKWVVALNELRDLFCRSGFLRKDTFVVRELYDLSAFPSQLRNVKCAAVIDQGRFVIGLADQGLLSVELDREVLIPVGGESENKKKNVEEVEYDAEEQLLIVLIPTAALDGRDLKWIKVQETRGCHLLCWGTGPHVTNTSANRQHYFATALNKSVLVFQINRSERRHSAMRERAIPGQPQSLSISQGRLFVGYPSSFRVWDLLDNSQISLVNLEDGSLQFLNQTLHDAEMIISVWPQRDSDNDKSIDTKHPELQQSREERPKEYLLVFQKLGLYVDANGRRSRSQELMFPCRGSTQSSFAYRTSHLLHFSEHQICVFKVQTAEWVQTINLRLSRPLHSNGLFVLCQILDLPHLVMLGSNQPAPVEKLFLSFSESKQVGLPLRKRKFTVRSAKDDARCRGDRRSQLPISGPSNFMHVVHMGPGNVLDLKNLAELNASNSPGCSTGGSNANIAERNFRQQLGQQQPLMRSTSTSSGSTQGQSTTTLSWMPTVTGAIPSTRPLSSHSRNSEASSLGKTTGKFTQQQLLKYQQQQQSQELESNDDYYLEPILKKGQQPSTAGASPAAPPAPPSIPQPKIPDDK
uniref:non-specific serine/threonine protein kinase n=1 Tax=Meloidogyne hapla TaxID=6305 RepID=A0A1I8BZ05_MELHA